MRRALIVITLLCALLVPAAAWAGSGDGVIRDCVQHGKLTKTYSQSQYQNALNNLPADLQEYSNCAEIIKQAKRSAVPQSHHSGSLGGGGNPGSGTTGGGTGGSSPGGGSPGGGASAPGAGGSTPRSGGGGGSGLGSPSAGASASAAGAGGAGVATTPTPLRPLTPQELRPASATAASRGLGALPTPLVVVLILLGFVALGALAAGARRRLPALVAAPVLRRVIPRRGA